MNKTEKIAIIKAKIKNYQDMIKGTTNVNTIDYCRRSIETCKKSLEVLGVK